MNAGNRKLSDLLQGLLAVPEELDRGIRGLALDSRQVEPGTLFLAFPGTRADGRDYIEDAKARGAVAVVFEGGDGYALADTGLPALAADGLAQMVGRIADRFYDSPSSGLTVIGVTGTNGKTTVSHLVAQALDGKSGRCAVIGTLGNGFPGALDQTLHTTPDAITLHRLMAEYRSAGATAVCVEVSSHALEQGRVSGVRFDIAVFTNLSRDHLDYHGDMDSYGAAKARLFEIAGLRLAVINEDDEYGQGLLADCRQRLATVGYGLQAGEFRATRVQATHAGLEVSATTPVGGCELRSPLFGRFNAYNLLAALAVLVHCELDLNDAARRLGSAHAVAGRMERFAGSKPAPLIVVDYAHTPDALEKVLIALREHTERQLWCVFGCGGDRDRGKRPQMGAVAERLADAVILTDDNPRHESPAVIVAEIQAGMKQPAPVVHDRAEAIRNAFSRAGAGDIVLVAGKGHEDYQQFGDERRPYSDRETVRQLMGEAA
jgi:UDP-N-acetylmuramoyl-L-alanyl-D-glutamate--2,6-diaminopimelate ligase